jgi:hypothetical protein
MTEGPGASYGTVFHPAPDAVRADGAHARIGQLRALPRRRRPAMLALAVALVGAGILASAALYRSVDHQVPVLEVTATVPVGGTLTAADLGTTTVAAGPGVQSVPARQEQQVIGLVADTTLRPGTLLASSDLTNRLPPAAGQVLVPVAVKPSQLPASGLAAGDDVLVVPVPASSGTSTGPAALAAPVPAVVQDVSAGPDSDGLDVVDLLVPAHLGTALAKQAAAGQIALVVTHRGT